MCKFSNFKRFHCFLFFPSLVKKLPVPSGGFFILSQFGLTYLISVQIGLEISLGLPHNFIPADERTR